MRTVVEPLEGNKVKLSVEVDEDEFEKAVDAAYRKIAHEVRIPGFRPGKAPRRILEARVGKEAARQEALRDALPDYYAQALDEAEVDAIAAPEIDITSGQDDGPIAFDAVVEVRPNVSVAGYQGLQVTVPSPVVSDDDVERQLDHMRRRDGTLTPVDRAARHGDYVTIDIKDDRDDVLYEVGSGTAGPGVDEQLVGAKVGDILTVGEQQQILLKEVKELALPDATDEWASEASEFETLAELRDDTRRRLSLVKRVQAHLALRDEVLKALVELVGDEPPQSLVDEELERRLHDFAHRLEAQGATIQQYLEATGTGEQELVDGLRGEAVHAVKADLGLRALVAAEGIEATDDDVEAEIVRLAERLGEKPAQLRRRLERADRIPTVRSDLRKAKALEWLVEHVEVVDEEGNPVDRADLQPPEPAQESE